MELELHQLDRRYEALRTSSRERDCRVVASLARDGQLLPVVVVEAGAGADRYVLVDGYKRVRGLQQLRHDVVRATCWNLPEDEALLLGRLMRSSEGNSALELAWLLRELQERFSLSREELARRFGRSESWVSRRLGMACDLPDEIQDLVRAGKLKPHAAMKYFLPLARANREGAQRLARAIAPLRPTTRQTAALCAAYARGNSETRAHLLKHPQLLLRELTPKETVDADPAQQLDQDVSALSAIVRRALRRMGEGAADGLLPPERARLLNAVTGAQKDVVRLAEVLSLESREVS